MALGILKVHAGDFQQGSAHQFLRGELWMKSDGKRFRERIPKSEIIGLEIASEENVKRISETLGWGIAGSLLLGPLGLVAGLLAGGTGKDVTFVCKLRDGRKFLGTASLKMYTEMSAVLFDRGSIAIATPTPRNDAKKAPGVATSVSAEDSLESLTNEIERQFYIEGSTAGDIARDYLDINLAFSKKHSEIEEIVVAANRNLHQLAGTLEMRYGINRKQAGSVAVLMENRATAQLARARQLASGVKRAQWQHTGGGKNPRKSHMEAHGKVFDLEKGLLVDGKLIFPGDMIDCGCVARPLFAGADYDDAVDCVVPPVQHAPPEPSPQKKVSIWLGLGTLVAPYVFAWFLLRKGYSDTSRYIGFIYLALFVIANLKR